MQRKRSISARFQLWWTFPFITFRVQLGLQFRVESNRNWNFLEMDRIEAMRGWIYIHRDPWRWRWGRCAGYLHSRPPQPRRGLYRRTAGCRFYRRCQFEWTWSLQSEKDVIKLNSTFIWGWRKLPVLGSPLLLGRAEGDPSWASTSRA